MDLQQTVTVNEADGVTAGASSRAAHGSAASWWRWRSGDFNKFVCGWCGFATLVQFVDDHWMFAALNLTLCIINGVVGWSARQPNGELSHSGPSTGTLPHNEVGGKT